VAARTAAILAITIQSNTVIAADTIERGLGARLSSKIM
jgi:hypothetical protein